MYLAVCFTDLYEALIEGANIVIVKRENKCVIMTESKMSVFRSLGQKMFGELFLNQRTCVCHGEHREQLRCSAAVESW